MITLALWGLAAHAGEGTKGLGAEMASLQHWDARFRALTARRDGSDDPVIIERLDAAATVLELLQELQPEVPRGRLRDLCNAAVDRHANIRQEAERAARSGLELPVVPDPEGWYARLPAEVSADIALSLGALDLGPLAAKGLDDGAVQAAMTMRATAAGWTLADDGPEPEAPADEAVDDGTAEARPTIVPVSGVVERLYGAAWNDRAGWAVDVRWTVGDASVVTRSVALGPMVLDTPEALVHDAFGNLLGQQDLTAPTDDPKLDEAALGTLCLFRKKHQDWSPMPVDLGGQPLRMGTGTYVCLEAPEGLTAASPSGHGSVTVVADTTTVAEVSHAEFAGQSQIMAVEQAKLDKLIKRKRVAEISLDGDG
ncbi:MAG: hypothetical protein KTR31_16920 [Myxococcales bacterium]|nr:hypothetical protein [Myxococcales bacterium]